MPDSRVGLLTVMVSGELMEIMVVLVGLVVVLALIAWRER